MNKKDIKWISIMLTSFVVMSVCNAISYNHSKLWSIGSAISLGMMVLSYIKLIKVEG